MKTKTVVYHHQGAHSSTKVTLKVPVYTEEEKALIRLNQYRDSLPWWKKIMFDIKWMMGLRKEVSL